MRIQHTYKARIAVLLAAILLVFVWFVVPVSRYLASAYGREISRWNLLDEVEQYKGLIPAKKQENRALAARLDNLKTAVPRSSRLSVVLNRISESAKLADLVINNMVAGKNVETREITEMPMALTAEGSYHRFGRFINTMERSGNIVRFTAMDLRAHEKRPGIIAGKLHVSVYFNNDERQVK
ncbi:MAG: hypothetical protein A2268_11800 [Candidatus Raymondbacteria bacterium RifOxyA12_full_50_37]|uniref:Type 4a pilus biogenesis protein PilO n=1 Tax=Candidatus Raymondbacteria bacterium RIFOXYD12_FULL_49_13 TaxID=1817890 RepID=A0A1F7FL57_UNCRA|nr:MAG: hypothetical protein A2268_11800 [Candidatus Raymondbacteria bacterium RifOxyA12_full_50_37]OGJ98727.1 MAG: hypothetical protein A2453_08245 [Candidatus Raymondbacteria bacterium RIFOXYC2_FULL_50_21]OGJ99177.1 MAG: hypothetical protein A2350_17965 [Candidatus Raymondbacteria bacterium RifOxyB12_full_50_8]OGK07445.1 MAG: hypothetical protein A2519_11140 [Candidatus Raymondbacteria bacterium RIFOXYD12_FULL_49_13]OGK07812.1 MAG: hypothetical protein A2487_00165 [Candidatus Raymondbacteria 